MDFDLTQLANMLDMPLLSSTLRQVIVEQVNHFMVLPNKLTFPLVQNIDLTSLKYPLPSVSHAIRDALIYIYNNTEACNATIQNIHSIIYCLTSELLNMST